MGTLSLIIITVLIAAILILTGYFIWYAKNVCNKNCKTEPNYLKSPFVSKYKPYTGPSYNDPEWDKYISGVILNGFTKATIYDNNSTSYSACESSIQTQAKAAADDTVIGWSWSSTKSVPNNCRAITTSNIKNPCTQPAVSPDEGYIGRTYLAKNIIGTCPT
jgi:hypothetical protein